jgi:hypothetical protein
VKNPFTPTFGVAPPILIGRTDLVTEFAEALDDGPGSPGRATLFEGPRGVGKTVMLDAAADVARERGWLVISESATPGLLGRITNDTLPRLLKIHDPNSTKRKLTGVNAPLNLGGVTWENVDGQLVTPGFQSRLFELLEVLKENETGVLLVIDEVVPKSVKDLVQIGATLQHAFREGHDFAFAATGLPSSLSKLTSTQGVTFLRRAVHHPLGGISLDAVAAAMRSTIEVNGRKIGDRALRMASEVTAGYPYLVQLVGFGIWKENARRVLITEDDVVAGAAYAKAALVSGLLEPILDDVTEKGVAFLRAMSVDDGPTRISDMEGRMGKDDKYVGTYRSRLLATQVISAPTRGFIDFTTPYMREFLRGGLPVAQGAGNTP